MGVRSSGYSTTLGMHTSRLRSSTTTGASLQRRPLRSSLLIEAFGSPLFFMHIIVLDTNVLVHFLRPDDPEWRNSFEGELLFVVPTTTLSELDVHKTSRDGKIRKRSRAILPWLENNDGREIAEGVTLELLATEPTRELLNEHHLDPSVPDDRIIAAALELERTRGAVVTLVSWDTTPRVKARQRGLQVMSPPDSLKVAETPSDEEAELAKTRRQLDALTSRIPKLRVTTLLGALALGPDDSEEREQHISNGMERMRASNNQGPFQIFGLNTLPEGYVDEYREYLEQREDHSASLARCAEVRLELENIGSLKASTVTIDISWDAEANYIELLPQPPEPPSRGGFEGFMHGPHVYLPDLLGKRNVSGPDGPVGGKSCSYSVKFLLHQRTLELPRLLLSFPRVDDFGGIALNWRVHCEELPEAISGCINLPVTPDRTTEEMLRMNGYHEDG